MIVLNFKAYSQSVGVNAQNLLINLSSANLKEIKVVAAVQTIDIQNLAKLNKFEIWAQHVDPIDEGPKTGWVSASSVKESGAVGTLLNHSEHKFANVDDLKIAHQKAKEVGLKTLIFASDIEEFKKLIELKPDYISYEPPEFIGRTDISVATAKPEVISEVFEIAKNAGVPLIVGAGIHDKTDIQKSLQLGAIGIAVATNIVKADDPKTALENLIEGFK